MTTAPTAPELPGSVPGFHSFRMVRAAKEADVFPIEA